jgi:hypothetical protein
MLGRARLEKPAFQQGNLFPPGAGKSWERKPRRSAAMPADGLVPNRKNAASQFFDR